MSMWKKWNKKSKSKDKPVDPKKAQEEDDDDAFELPPTLSRNKDRNMSISRSGRHKMRKHQRLSVVSGDMYSPEGDTPNEPAWPQANSVTPNPTSAPAAHSNVAQSKMPSSSGSSNYHCRETVDPSANQLPGSQRMASAPTAV